MAFMKDKFAGYSLRNSVFAASCPATESEARIKSCYEAGFGGAVLKTAADYTRTGSGYGRKVVYVGSGFFADGSTESEILTLREGVALFKSALKYADKMMIIPSVCAASLDVDDWIKVCKPFVENGAKILQLDFFYLGTLYHNEKFYTMLENLLTCLTREFTIMPKLNFNFDPDIACRLLKKCGIKQVSLLDSLRYNPPQRYGLHNGSTSYFGHAQLELTLLYLRAAAKSGLEICAGGGVCDKKDYDLLRTNGASVVQIASAILKSGYGVINQFTNGSNVVHNPWCDVEDGAKCTACGGCAGRSFNILDMS